MFGTFTDFIYFCTCELGRNPVHTMSLRTSVVCFPDVVKVPKTKNLIEETTILPRSEWNVDKVVATVR